ncbi:hypothetical protein JGH11_05620 [Dysgonomonas sp. Marseille-P4677]|uniref:hypothetical protein n=1 Tax=Dysgonomonas sp. Marseille-P4677 TaxID=2364790 RepID=UPI0019129C66|nr:hypothetical protein [Dysgonomonas sp. Marseille-P4677]MBK5720343.1 hypothetical protein [Dysgonomonas sp. Marseille-P4677]
MKTRYEQIVDVEKIASFNNRVDIAEVISLAKEERMAPISQDNKQILLLAIDVQNDFMENIGSLSVQGSKGDVERLTSWIYNNTKSLTQIICSLDSHSITQIFHANWWVDNKSNNPPPFTIITYQDVINGKWQAANGEKDRSLEYLKNLELTSKKQLCIWPYHCLEGTNGAKLENEFTKMLYFHSAARSSTPIFIYKGQNPYTEMYGIVKAEYDPENYVNQLVLDAVEEYDEIYIAGEASSHCVLASTVQILEYFSDRKDIITRITLLEDCMSPIVGFEESTRLQYLELKERYGIQIKKTVDVIL